MGVIVTFFSTFGVITTLTVFPGCWYIIQELKYAMSYSYGKRVFVVLRPIMDKTRTNQVFKLDHNVSIRLAILMDRRRTNQVFKLDRNVSIRVAMLMGRYAERLQLPSNEYCQACGSAAFTFFASVYHSLMGRYEEKLQLPSNRYCQACGSAAFHFLCQCLSLAKYRFRLLGCPFLICLTKLSPFDIRLRL